MIERNINEALLKDQPSVNALVNLLVDLDERMDLGNVSLYHEFPIYLDETGDKSIKSDVLFISQKHGVIVFKCIEYSERVGLEAENIAESLNQIDRLIFAKILKDAPRLQKDRRGLKVEIAPTIYLNNCEHTPSIHQWSNFEVICSETELKSLISKNEIAELSDGDYKDLKATIEGSKGLIKPTSRKVKDIHDLQNSRGAILTTIENDVYNFDIEQKRAAQFTIDGAQRIRGLAGSGKTVILAMKAALIHLQNPSADILFTYNTKNLHDLIKSLITRFYRQFTEQDPNWNKIQIMHAWGGFALEGVYSNACHLNNITPLKLSDAQKHSPDDPFGYVCKELNLYKLKKQYDYAILDEAQDFPKYFYRICRQITRMDRVIWAYDDFQNILNVNIQDEKETFGKDENGQYHIDFSRKDDELQDIVLHKCYRNPRKILLTAFALGLGIYNKDSQRPNNVKIIQRLENNDHWKDLGFEVESGNSEVGDKMIVSRPEINSPLIKNQNLDEYGHIVRVKAYKNISEECEHITAMILDDLDKELNPEDISVVSLDNRFARIYFTNISRMLEEKGIKTFSLQNAPNNNKTYKQVNHVTLATIFRAKGNESGSIYVIGIDAIFRDKDNLTERNKLFTAITRSMAWVTLTGIAPFANIGIREIKDLIENDFKLIFTQPSADEVNMIRQDLSQKQRKLNAMERIKEELGRLGMSDEEVKNHLFKP